MNSNQFNKEYWKNRWKLGETQWDVGQVSSPLKKYIDGLSNKSLKILVPGAGNAYEGIYLIQNGFTKTILLDICEEPLNSLIIEASIPKKNIVIEDFFEHTGKYDLILEQTFFCSLQPDLRAKYVQKCYDLLEDGGKIVGLLFNHSFNLPSPPFGGNENEYNKLFSPLFAVNMAPCYNSIEPRQNRELFIQFVKK